MNDNDQNKNISTTEITTLPPQTDEKPNNNENNLIALGQDIIATMTQTPNEEEENKDKEKENNPQSDITDANSKAEEINKDEKDENPQTEQSETKEVENNNETSEKDEKKTNEEETKKEIINDDEKETQKEIINDDENETKKEIINDDENETKKDDENETNKDDAMGKLDLLIMQASSLTDVNNDSVDNANHDNAEKNISDDIPPPRVVQRREFEKSDAAVQMEDEEDPFFQTAVDSPVDPDNNSEKSRTVKSRRRSNRYQEDTDDDSYMPEPTRQFSDEELEAALKRQIKTKKLPPLEMREELINYARSQSLFKLMEEDYDAASKIDDAIEMNIQSLQQNEVKTDINQQTLTLQEHLEDAIQQKAIIEQRHKERIEEFKKLEQQRLDDLRAQHDNERKLFEEEWTKEETLLKFNKPSQKLFQIRRQQKAMAISHDFQNARYLKKMGDQLQKQESDIATQRAADSMRNKYLGLLAKQEKEEQCLIEYGIRRLGQLQIERDAELRANEVHRNALEVKIKTPKFVKKPKVQIPRTSYGSRSRGANSQSVPGVVSNRARSQFATFKKADDKRRLEIKLGDVRRITKPLTPVSRKNDAFPFTF